MSVDSPDLRRTTSWNSRSSDSGGIYLLTNRGTEVIARAENALVGSYKRSPTDIVRRAFSLWSATASPMFAP